MSDINPALTPAWEDKELVWAPEPPDEDGEGYIYASIQTGRNLVTSYIGKTFEVGGQPSQVASIFADEFREAANNIIRRLFKVDDERFGGDLENQIEETKKRLEISDIDVTSISCKKNTILFRLTFNDLVESTEQSLLDGLDYDQSVKLLWGLKNAVITSPLFGEGTEITLEDLENLQDINFSTSNSKPDLKDSESGTKSPGLTGAKPEEEKSLPPNIPPPLTDELPGAPGLRQSGYYTQSEKEQEDLDLKENDKRIEDLQKNVKGRSIFALDDPYRTELTSRIDARVQQRIDSIEDAYDKFLDEFDIKKFACQAAACFGVELPIEETERIFLLSLIRNQPCEEVVDMLDVILNRVGADLATQQDTAFEEGREEREEFNRNLDRLNQVAVGRAANPVISSLSLPKIREILQSLRTGIVLIGEEDIASNDFSPIMPQEIEDIVDALGALPPEEAWQFFESNDLKRQILLKVCELDKDVIVDYIKSLDDIDKLQRGNTQPELSNVLLKSVVTDAIKIPLPQLELISNCDFEKFFAQFKLPKIPTIRIPDIIPTIDQLGLVMDGIAESLFSALEAALVSMVTSILDAVRQACDQGALGDLDIGNVLSESARTIGETEARRLKDNIIRNLRDASEIDESIETIAASFGPFIDSVSKNLKPIDVFNLLLGSASEDITDTVDCIMSSNEEFGVIRSSLNDAESINNFFFDVGRLTDKNVLLQSLIVATEPKSPSGKDLQLNCPSPQEEIERNALIDNGISPEEADKQVERARDRRRKRLSELADIMNKEDLLDGVLPPDDPCSTPENFRGPTLSEEPKVIEDMVSKTIDAIYDGIYISFNQEIDNFADSITFSEEEEVKIPYTTSSVGSDGTTNTVLNPEIQRLLSDGVTIDNEDLRAAQQAPEKDRQKKIEKLEGEEFDGRVLVSKVAPRLRGYLSGLENNNSLFYRDASLSQYRLVVPNEIEPENFDRDSVGLNANNASAPQPEEYFIDYTETPVSDIDKQEYSIGISLSPSEDVLLSTSQNVDVGSAVAQVRQSFAGAQSFSPRLDFGRLLEGAILSNPEVDASMLSVSMKQSLSLGHFSLFKSVLSIFSNDSSESIFFDKDILSLVDFTPELTPEQRNKGCKDPHILDLQKTKEDVRQDYKSAKCKKDPSENFSLNTKVGEFENSALGGVIRTTIRLNIVDLCLKSIFPLSKFNFGGGEGELDDLIKSLCTRYIADILENVGTKYFEDFQKQATLYHNEKAGNPNFSWTSKTRFAEEAIKDLVELEYKPTVNRISEVLGFQDFRELKDRVLNDYLPLYDLQKDRVQNRFDVEPRSISGNEKLLSPGDGSLILEKYVSKDFIRSPIGNTLEQVEWDNGLMSVERFKEYIESNYREGDPTPISDVFNGPIKIGLRLTYVDRRPLGSQRNPLFAFFDTDFIPRSLVLRQKAFGLRERVGASSARPVFTVPLIKSEVNYAEGLNLRTMGELREALMTRSELMVGGGGDVDDTLLSEISADDKFQFLFDYCFPVERILFLVVAYNTTYFSYNKNLNELFTQTRVGLKGLFYSMLNVDNTEYVDEELELIGGNRGAATSALNNSSNSSYAPLIAALAAKTPLLILKGLVELIDPNIGLAKKIKMAAMLAGKDIPMPLASLAALPINVFPPPPLGPGIGPPITPLGVAYLATGAHGALKSSEEKQFEKEQAESKISELTLPIKTDECPTGEE